MDRINAHRHLFRSETVDSLLGEMDEQGVAHTVLLPMPDDIDFQGEPMVENAGTFALVAGRRDRLSALVYLDPRDPEALRELKRYADQGAVGVKMWPPVGYYPDELRYYHIYREVERRGLPVMIHTGYTDCGFRGDWRPSTNTRYAMPLELDGLIRTFPGITWLYAHAGNPDFATGLQHAATHANVYLNINGMADESGWDSRLFRYYEKMAGACAPLSWDKLLWGTDNIGFDFAGYDGIFARFGQADHLGEFYFRNARRIYGIAS